MCVRVRVYVRVCVCACLPLSLACPPAAGRPVQSPQPQRTSMKDLMASSGEVFGLSALGHVTVETWRCDTEEDLLPL